MLPLTLTRRRRKKNVRLTHAQYIFIAREWNEQEKMKVSTLSLYCLKSRLFCIKKWNKSAWAIYGMRVQLSCPIGVSWNCVHEESGSWDNAEFTIYHLYEQLLMPSSKTGRECRSFFCLVEWHVDVLSAVPLLVPWWRCPCSALTMQAYNR